MRDIIGGLSHHCGRAAFNSESCFLRNLEKRIQSQVEVSRVERNLKSHTMKNDKRSQRFLS